MQHQQHQWQHSSGEGRTGWPTRGDEGRPRPTPRSAAMFVRPCISLAPVAMVTALLHHTGPKRGSFSAIFMRFTVVDLLKKITFEYQYFVDERNNHFLLGNFLMYFRII